MQTDATCNIQQCWELLANNAASVCTGLKANYVRTVQDSFCASLCKDPPPLPLRGGVYTQATFVRARKPYRRIGLLFYKRGRGSELGPSSCMSIALTTRPHSLLRLTLKQVTHLDTNQPTACAVFYACTQPFHPGSGSHGHACRCFPLRPVRSVRFTVNFDSS